MHIENADLNLLKTLDVLLEERHISRAAARFHLSQSAMSRTLVRLRATFGDELLVRTARGYELTPRARAIQRELAFVMPRLQSLVRADAFSPSTATDIVRMHATDYLTTVLGPGLFGEVFRQAPDLSLHVDPLSPGTFDDIEHGRVDLALCPVRPPAPLRWASLFEERFVCVLSADHPAAAEAVTIDDIARYPHASVVALQSERMLVDRQLAELGVGPRPGLRVPYFTAVVAALHGTRLIAILPSRFAARYAADDALRIAAAPPEMDAFTYGMLWHPRLNTDPVHAWLRDRVIDASLELEDAPKP